MHEYMGKLQRDTREQTVEQQLEDALREIAGLRDLVDTLEQDREDRDEYDRLVEYVTASADPIQLAEEWWEDRGTIRHLNNKMDEIKHHLNNYVEGEGLVSLRDALLSIVNDE